MLPEYPHKTKIINSKEYLFDELRKKWIISTPEEIVRQNCWKFLHHEKNYPISHIAIEKQFEVNNQKKRFDIVVFDKKGNPNLLVECKAPEIAISNETMHQVLTYQHFFKAKVLILTNGKNTYCIDINLESKKATYLDQIPFY